MIPERVYNNRLEGTWADGCRRRRFKVFQAMVEGLPKPIRILDVGGTPTFWERMGLAGDPNYQITLLNIYPLDGLSSNMRAVLGDARSMSGFGANEFDIAFSNSVIEHVGSLDDMDRMACEVRRVAKRYFIQTPNRFFPIEPHFVFPLFQFMPLRLQVMLGCRFSLGWFSKFPSKEAAKREIESIRLLTRSELRALFPGAHIVKETYWGLTKSFVALSAPPGERPAWKT